MKLTTHFSGIQTSAMIKEFQFLTNTTPVDRNVSRAYFLLNITTFSILVVSESLPVSYRRSSVKSLICNHKVGDASYKRGRLMGEF